jgi:hypothetical protein
MQFRIFSSVYNAHCSLLFHSLGIENVCEGAPMQQGIFNMIKCVGKLHVSFRSKCFSPPFLLSAFNLEIRNYLTPSESAIFSPTFTARGI